METAKEYTVIIRNGIPGALPDYQCFEQLSHAYMFIAGMCMAVKLISRNSSLEVELLGPDGAIPLPQLNKEVIGPWASAR